MYGIYRLVASGNGIVEVFAVKNVFYRTYEFFYVGFLGFVRFLEQAHYVLVGLRFGVFEREVFQFRFYIVQPQSVCQRSVYVQRFGSDFLLLLAYHRVHRLHVVKAVGDFYKYHPYIVRYGDEHLAEIFRLYAYVRVRYAGYFRQSVDDTGYRWAVFAFYVFEGYVGILHHIVQQGGSYGRGVEAHLRSYYRSYGYRVEHVRLARTPALVHVSLYGLGKGFVYKCGVLLAQRMVVRAQKAAVGFQYVERFLL